MAELAIADSFDLFTSGDDSKWLYGRCRYFAWDLSTYHNPDDGIGREGPHQEGQHQFRLVHPADL